MKMLTWLFVLVFSITALAMNGRTTYQAKIIKPNGYPLEASSVNFRFTVLDTVGSCILYVEDYSAINMTDSGGVISFALGNGTRSFPTSGTSQTFQNTFDNSINSFSCLNAGIYNPSANDTRRIVMQFNDGVGGWQSLPAMSINAVPYAMYASRANDTKTLNGKADSAFVENSTLAALNCNPATHAITFNGASFSCVAVGSGSGTITSVTTSGSVLTTLGTASAPVITIQAASVSQDGYLTSLDYAEFKAKLSASNTQIISALGYAPVSSSAVAAQIDSAATASATANAIVKRDSSGNFTANDIFSNAAKLNYVDLYKPSTSFNIRLQAPTSLSADYVLSLPTTSGTTGQVLSTDGTGNLSWVNPSTGTLLAANNLSDVASASAARNSLGLGSLATLSFIDLGTTFVSGTLAIARTPAYTGDVTKASASDTLILSNSGVTAGTYTKLTVDSKGRVTSASALASSDVTAALGYAPVSATAASQWTTSGTAVFYTAGDVGIGTANPLSKLDVNGAVYASGFTIFNHLYSNSNELYFNAIKGPAINKSSPGLASAPSYTFVPARDSGLFQPLAGTVALSTSGLERLRIDSDGNIGIGTASPTAKLDVSGTIKISGGAPGLGKVLTSDASGAATWQTLAPGNSGDFKADGSVSMTGVFLATDGNQTAPAISFASDPDTGIARIANNSLNFITGGAYQVNLDSTGLRSSNVFGWYLNPVNGSATTPNFSWLFDSDTGMYRAAADILAFTTSGTERLRIDSTGNVGIGTAAATAKLHLTSGTTLIAPLKFTSGTLLTSPQSGAIEFDGANFFLTDSTNTRSRVISSENTTPTSGQVLAFNGAAWAPATISTSGGTSGTAVAPAGMISAFPMSTCPAGWIAANGAAVSRVTYSTLFAAIGTTYGVGDGSTTFNTPDYRGYFLRGLNNGSGNDPDAASRTNRGDGTTGDNVGTKQVDQFQGHLFNINNINGNLTSGWNLTGGGGQFFTGPTTYTTTGPVTDGTNGTPRAGSETRAKNISVLYCVSTATSPATTVATTGTGTTNYIPLWTSSVALGDSPIAVNGSNVGIGTTNPEGALAIAGNNHGSASSQSVSLGRSGAYSSVELKGSASNTGGGFIDFGYPSNDFAGRIIYENTDNSMSLYTASAERFRISSTGNVGIGTATPNNKLEVNGTILVTAGAIGTNLINGSFSNNTNRSYMDSSGYFWSTMDAAAISANLYLHRNNTSQNFITFGYGASAVGSVTTNGSSVSYNTTSDYRLKENISPMTDSISRILKLEPKRFNYKSTPNERVDGFIAHEVAEVVPEATQGKKDAIDKDGKIIPQVVDYSKVVPVITGALREIINEVRGLASILESKADKSEIESLKAENARLKAYLCDKDPTAPICK